MLTQILLLSFCCCFFFPLSLAHNKPTHHDQCSALLDFKHGMHTVGEDSKVTPWNSTTDCCSWDGITCNPTTHNVIRLDISGDDMVHGEISSNSSLFRLVHLQLLDLSGNNFTSQFPSGFGHLTSLTHLDLSSTGLFGQIPEDISLLKNLISLRLSSEDNQLRLEKPNLRALVQNLSRLRDLTLVGVDMKGEVNHDWCDAISSSLPQLQQLVLFDTNLSGPIPPSIGNLKSLIGLVLSYSSLYGAIPSTLGNLDQLQRLVLSDNNLDGSIPLSFEKFDQLESLDLSWNNFSGPIPPLKSSSKTIRFIDLSNNHFTCPIPSSYTTTFPNLTNLSLQNNSLSGDIPSSLFSLPSLRFLLLNDNQFSGEIQDFLAPSSSSLEEVNLSMNELQGLIPTSIFKFPSLQTLDLHSNKFSGTVDPKLFENLTNFAILDLSNNHLLTIKTNVSISQMPNLAVVDFSSCNVNEFPKFLKNQPQLQQIDLSNTTMAGQIPNWVWTETLLILNLSLNSLTEFERPSPNISTSSLVRLDLHSNKFQNSLPKFSPTLYFLSVSNNSFTGKISHWICNMSQLDVLDLSHNQLTGIIPPCLGNISSTLSVLDVRANNFHGVMPQDFAEDCRLEILKFSDNQLEGRLARSLASCRNLKVLDMGNNHIHDTFPHWLGGISVLKVLILRSNRFYGRLRDTTISTPFLKLHIIDLSNNSFSGTLPTKYFQCWKAMMTSNETQLGTLSKRSYYQYEVRVTSKGQEIEYAKDILISLVNVVDMSNNKFEGEVSESIGRLKSLITLNLSRNYLIGEIPSVMGNLTALESLDLSQNKLSGEIPTELARLTSLSVLNLSWNLLVGRIPTGGQFNTFTASSFEGNAGLCGFPLPPNECHHDSAPPPVQHSLDAKPEDDFSWVFVLSGYASGLVIGIVIEHFILWRNRSYFMKFMRVANFFQENSCKKKIKKKKTLRRANVR